jgi:hypothetical protein
VVKLTNSNSESCAGDQFLLYLDTWPVMTTFLSEKKKQYMEYAISALI